MWISLKHDMDFSPKHVSSLLLKGLISLDKCQVERFSFEKGRFKATIVLEVVGTARRPPSKRWYQSNEIYFHVILSTGNFDVVQTQAENVGFATNKKPKIPKMWRLFKCDLNKTIAPEAGKEKDDKNDLLEEAFECWTIWFQTTPGCSIS